MASSIDHDRLFKQLLKTFFLEFLDLFAAELAAYINRDSLEFLPQEYFTELIDGERRSMDLIVRVKLNTRANSLNFNQLSVIINCEHQSSSEANFNRRMFFYVSQLYREYLQPVYPIAIFSYAQPKNKREPNTFEINLPGLDVLKFNFLTIQLNQLNWRDFLNQKNPIAAALMSKMKIAPADRPKVKVECLRIIATLQLDPARVSVLSGFVDNYLRLNLEEEAAFTREIAKIKVIDQQEKIMEIVTSWMEQGEQKAMIKSVLRVLNRRIGSLDERSIALIQKLSVSELENLLDAALDFTSLTDLQQWLNFA